MPASAPDQVGNGVWTSGETWETADEPASACPSTHPYAYNAYSTTGSYCCATADGNGRRVFDGVLRQAPALYVSWAPTTDELVAYSTERARRPDGTPFPISENLPDHLRRVVHARLSDVHDALEENIGTFMEHTYVNDTGLPEPGTHEWGRTTNLTLGSEVLASGVDRRTIVGLRFSEVRLLVFASAVP